MIGIRYSCRNCCIQDAEVDVPLRDSAEDVVHWMERTVMVALARDHRGRSPDCHPEVLSDIKIPTDGRRFVGGPVEN